VHRRRLLRTDEDRRGRSQDFAKGDSTEAISDVVIFKSEQQAEDAMSEHAEGLAGAAAEDCVQDLVEEAFKEEGGFKFGEIDVGELSFTPLPGVDEAKAWQIVIPVEITSGVGKGFEPDVYLELVILREGDTRRRPVDAGRPDGIRSRPARQARPDD
jgi:hypothetical protein